MNELPIETIRETSRNLLVLNRRKNRDDEADIRRSMQNMRILPDTVHTIANKLKTKSSVSMSELKMLKNALIDDASNIETVLNTHGALRGLVRELTGHEVNKQCAAAGCCCNLALGDSRAGVAVAKAAGSYLVSALDNLTTELAVTSAWTLGNLAGSGPKACELLIAQGAVSKLIELLTSSNNEISDAAMYAVVRCVYQLKDDLRTEHLHKIFEILPSLEVNETSQLLFILSCHKDFSSVLVTEELLGKLLQYLVGCKNKNNEQNVIHIFRFLANCDSKEIFEIVLQCLLQHRMMAMVLRLAEIDKSLFWFLGNAYKLCSGHVFFEMIFV